MMAPMPEQTPPRYTVTDDAQNTIEGVVPDTLQAFLRDCDGTAVLRRDDWPDRYAAARRDDTGWRVKIADQHEALVAHTPNTDATLDVLRAWAEEDDWWAEAFTWTPGQI